MIQTIDNTPKVVAGKIVQIHGIRNDAGFYTADSVSYDIAARLPDKQNVVTFRRQLPQIRLWAGDMEINADKLNGVGVVGVLMANRVQWHFVEPPALGACSTAPTIPGGTTVIQPLNGTPPLPTGPATGDTGAGGGSVTPAPGGGEI